MSRLEDFTRASNATLAGRVVKCTVAGEFGASDVVSGRRPPHHRNSEPFSFLAMILSLLIFQVPFASAAEVSQKTGPNHLADRCFSKDSKDASGQTIGNTKICFYRNKIAEITVISRVGSEGQVFDTHWTILKNGVEFTVASPLGRSIAGFAKRHCLVKVELNGKWLSLDCDPWSGMWELEH